MIFAAGFNLWLNDKKIEYFNSRVQILADEDGMFSRPFTDKEYDIYCLAHADYVKEIKCKAAHGSTSALNILWDLVKRDGLTRDEYYVIKGYYNGEPLPYPDY